ncbi:MAG: hypothetical protein L3J74_02760 [Bacteroidales bacterium]|nr:hypothetical protein [Bacteroidales bacterium]
MGKLKHIKLYEEIVLSSDASNREKEYEEYIKIKTLKIEKILKENEVLDELEIGDLPIKSLYNLKEIGVLNLENNKTLKSLGKLEKADNLNLYNTNIKDLGNLKDIKYFLDSTKLFFCKVQNRT